MCSIFLFQYEAVFYLSHALNRKAPMWYVYWIITLVLLFLQKETKEKEKLCYIFWTHISQKNPKKTCTWKALKTSTKTTSDWQLCHITLMSIRYTDTAFCMTIKLSNN